MGLFQSRCPSRAKVLTSLPTKQCGIVAEKRHGARGLGQGYHDDLTQAPRFHGAMLCSDCYCTRCLPITISLSHPSPQLLVVIVREMDVEFKR